MSILASAIRAAILRDLASDPGLKALSEKLTKSTWKTRLEFLLILKDLTGDLKEGGHASIELSEPIQATGAAFMTHHAIHPAKHAEHIGRHVAQVGHTHAAAHAILPKLLSFTKVLTPIYSLLFLRSSLHAGKEIKELKDYIKSIEATLDTTAKQLQDLNTHLDNQLEQLSIKRELFELKIPDLKRGKVKKLIKSKKEPIQLNNLSAMDIAYCIGKLDPIEDQKDLNKLLEILKSKIKQFDDIKDIPAQAKDLFKAKIEHTVNLSKYLRIFRKLEEAKSKEEIKQVFSLIASLGYASLSAMLAVQTLGVSIPVTIAATSLPTAIAGITVAGSELSSLLGKINIDELKNHNPLMGIRELSQSGLITKIDSIRTKVIKTIASLDKNITDIEAMEKRISQFKINKGLSIEAPLHPDIKNNLDTLIAKKAEITKLKTDLTSSHMMLYDGLLAEDESSVGINFDIYKEIEDRVSTFNVTLTDLEKRGEHYVTIADSYSKLIQVQIQEQASPQKRKVDRTKAYKQIDALQEATKKLERELLVAQPDDQTWFNYTSPAPPAAGTPASSDRPVAPPLSPRTQILYGRRKGQAAPPPRLDPLGERSTANEDLNSLIPQRPVLPGQADTPDSERPAVHGSEKISPRTPRSDKH